MAAILYQRRKKKCSIKSDIRAFNRIPIRLFSVTSIIQTSYQFFLLLLLSVIQRLTISKNTLFLFLSPGILQLRNWFGRGMGGRGARWIVARFRRREGRRESRGQRVRCGQRFHGTSRVRVNFCLNIFLPSLLIFSLFKFSRYLSDEELRADEEDKEDMVNILYDEWYAREKYRKLNVNTRWPTNNPFS